MRFFLAFCLFSNLFFTSLFAQTDFTYPNPDNSSLSKLTNGSGDVDYYTGKINLNLPLIDVSSKELKLGFSLNYSNNGVIYQEYSSSIGLGWNLLGAGGVYRTVRGYPDDSSKGYLGTGMHGQKIEKALLQGEYLDNKYFALTQEYDSEPDIYLVRTPYFEFEFTFDAAGNIISRSGNGLVVVPSYYVNSEISNNVSSFKVIDKNGTEYYFASKASNRDLTTEKIGSDYVSYTSAWHLDKIVSPSKDDIINLEYSRYSTIYELYNYYSWYKGVNATANELSSHQQNVNKMYLSKVLTKYGFLQFNYIKDRVDIENGAPRLQGIVQYAYNNGANIFIKKIDFIQSYFGNRYSSIQSGVKRSDVCRLKLDRILVSFNINENGKILKEFVYNESDHSATYNRKEDRTDYLGNFTIFTTGDPMDDPSLRSPYNVDLTSLHQLTRVVERSGAYKEFIYEHNAYRNYTIASNEIVGGLRVQEVRLYESPTELPVTVNYIYESQGISTGTLFNLHYKDFEASQVSRTGFPLSTVVKSSPIYNIESFLVGYSKVKEIQPNGSALQYEFNTKLHADSIVRITIRDNLISTKTPYALSNSANLNGYNSRFSGGLVSQNYKRASLSKLIHLDASGKKLFETSYVYEPLGGKKSGYGLKSNTIFLGYGKTTIYGIYAYHTVNDNYVLKKEINKEYLGISDSSMKEVTYSYHNNKYLVRSIESKDSKGSIIKRTMFYPEDGNLVPMSTSADLIVYNNLKNLNIKNVVLHERNEIGTSETLKNHMMYKVPLQLVETKSFRSIGGQSDLLQSHNNYYYQPSTRLLSMTKELKSNYISRGYDAKDRLIVEVNNAKSVPLTGTSSNTYYEFYYDGFENEVSNNSYAGVGSKAVPFSVPFTMPNNRRYIIDYRYLDNVTQKWKYAKKRYTNNYVINEGIRIDEVRVYPEDSDIVSTTYDEIGLKTSVTNNFGQTEFYEYDERNRLTLILNSNKDIIKMYCYNLKGEQTNCYTAKVGRYASVAKTQLFTKNDCPLDYYSEPVEYTVGTGAYRSNISQAHADQLAQDDIDANGQNYANQHGYCEPPTDCIRYRVWIPNEQVENLDIYVNFKNCNNLMNSVSIEDFEIEEPDYDNGYAGYTVFYLCVHKSRTTITFKPSPNLPQDYIPGVIIENVGYCR